MNALQNQRIRYLLAGGWNTIFGYGLGVGLYLWLSPWFHVTVIGLVAGIFAISMSFLTYKVFVFKTEGNWLREYARSYVVYGGSTLISTGLLWFFVDQVHLPIWVAQALAIVVTVIISYLGHSRYTFKRDSGKAKQRYFGGKKKTNKRNLSLLQRRRKRKRVIRKGR